MCTDSPHRAESQILFPQDGLVHTSALPPAVHVGIAKGENPLTPDARIEAVVHLAMSDGIDPLSVTPVRPSSLAATVANSRCTLESRAHSKQVEGVFAGGMDGNCENPI